MYKTRSQLKQEARKVLAGRWGTAVAMTLVIIFVGATLGPNTNNIFYSMVLPILSTILNQLLIVGFCSFFLKLHCGQLKSANYMDLFYGFKCHPGKTILLYLLTLLYMLPGILVYTIGIAIFTFVIYASAGVSMDLMMTGTVPIDLTLLSVVLIVFIVMTILFLIYSLYIGTTYSMVYFLLLDYPDLSVTEIWRRSAKMMKGNRLRLIGLELSFLPWMLVCILFTLGIGLLWLSPYMYSAQTAFYLDLVQNQSCKAENFGAPNPQDFGTASPHNVYPLPKEINDTNLTHDCEEAHPETQANRGTDYSGIDQNTFK